VGTIPATGTGSSGPLALIGIVVLLAGAVLLGQGRRLRRS
jgi:LPXTG-motif cell wall-anchored protein